MQEDYFPLPLVVNWIGPGEAYLSDGIGFRLSEEETNTVMMAINRGRSSVVDPVESTDRPKKVKQPGIVYVVSDGKLYKIGVTRNIEQRLMTLSRGRAEVLEAVWTSKPMDDPESLERDMHEWFTDKRKRGEWFALEQRDVDHIRMLGR